MNERVAIPPLNRLQADPTGATLSRNTTAENSAVAWGAVLAGAAGAAALSLILMVLGVGLGFSSVSPWSGHGLGATAIGLSTILWLSLSQILASGMGGYLAGRLRHRWLEVDLDETYFRDTAHGFLAWGVATLVTAALLASTVASVVDGGAQVAASAGSAVATTVAPAAAGAMGGAAAGNSQGSGADSRGEVGYFVDSLFRRGSTAPASGSTVAPNSGAAAASGQPSPGDGFGMSGSTGSNAASTAEATRILARAAGDGALPQEDLTYLGQQIAARTGLSTTDAEQRVTATFNKLQAARQQAVARAKEAADQARKAAALTSLWLFVSLLIGAFVASFAATHGGRRRDLY